jgi:hypothetical protein
VITRDQSVDNDIPYSLFLIPYSLFLIPYSLFLIPYSLFLIPYSLFLIPYSLPLLGRVFGIALAILDDALCKFIGEVRFA